MIELHLLDTDNAIADSFQSAALAELFAANSFTVPGLPVADSAPTAQWNADAAIAGLETLQEDLTPKTVSHQGGGAPVIKAETELTDLDRQAIVQGPSRSFTQNDQAMIEILAPLGAAAVPQAPAGYQDLLQLIAVLKEGRNRALQIQVVSL